MHRGELQARGFEARRLARVVSELPRRWTGIDNDADQSPPLGRLRGAVAEIRGDFGDVLYYRAVVWCKKYAPQGQLENCWADLAVKAATAALLKKAARAARAHQAVKERMLMPEALPLKTLTASSNPVTIQPAL